MSQAQSQGTSNIQLALDQAAQDREQADLALAQLRAQLNANTSKIASLAAELEATQKQLDHYAYNLPVVERQKLRADKRLNALREHADRVAKELAAERRMQEYLEELQKDDEESERKLKEYLGELLSRETEGFSDSDSDESESWSVLSDSINSKVQARQVASSTSPVRETKSVHELPSMLGLSFANEDSDSSRPTAIQPQTSSSSPLRSLPQLPPSNEPNASSIPKIPPSPTRHLSPPSSFTPTTLEGQASSDEAMPRAPLPAEIVSRTTSPSPSRRAILPIPAEEQPHQISQESGPAPRSVVSTPQDPGPTLPGPTTQPEPEGSDVVETLEEEQGPQDPDSALPAPAELPSSISPNGTRVPTHSITLASPQQSLILSVSSANHERVATPRSRASSLTSDVAPPRSPLPTPDISQETHVAPPTPHSPGPSGHTVIAIESSSRSNSRTPTGSPRAETSPPPCGAAFTAQQEAPPAGTSQSPGTLARSHALPPSPQSQSTLMTADVNAPEESCEETSEETDLESEANGSERLEKSLDGAPGTQLQEYESQEDQRDDEEEESDDDDSDEEEVTSEEDIIEQDAHEDSEEGSTDNSDPEMDGGGSNSSAAPSTVDTPSPSVISTSLPSPETSSMRDLPTASSRLEPRPVPSASTTRPLSGDSAILVATTSDDAIANKDATESVHPSIDEAGSLNTKPTTVCSPLDPATVHVYPPSCAPNAFAHPPPGRNSPYSPIQLLSAFRNRYANSNDSDDWKLISYDEGAGGNQSAAPMNREGRPRQLVPNGYPPKVSASTSQA